MHSDSTFRARDDYERRLAGANLTAHTWMREKRQGLRLGASRSTAAAARAALHNLARLPPLANAGQRRTPPPSMVRLLNLHNVANQLAATVPDILAHPEVARAIEQELLNALIACLVDPVAGMNPNPNRQRIMQQFHQMIEANQYEPLYLPEICGAIGVPERTLNSVCTLYLGMSPRRYLWLRRMNLVRRALTLADPIATTVTVIANDHGFGELGRFAVAYRALYGEPPSTTLRRTPSDSADGYTR
jgi:AraC-like DNA-binding protein